jgi:hypothetical protein
LFDGAKAQMTRLCSESGRILGKLSKAMPGGKAFAELFAIERSAQ